MYALSTAPTPNGWSVSVLLEELGVPSTVRPIDVSTLAQKQPWFLAIEPNGRIPVRLNEVADAESVKAQARTKHV